MATNKNKKASDLFVTGAARKPVARPEPPHRHRATKRNRDRSAQRRNAIRDAA